MIKQEVRSALSAREWQIAELAAQGLTDKEIQRRLGLSASTISTYWKRIREKLQTVNRAQAIAKLAQAKNGHRGKEWGQPLAGAVTVHPSSIDVTFAPGRWLGLRAD